MQEKILNFINQDLLSGREDIAIDVAEGLLESGFIDSLAMMRLVAFVESELTERIPTEDLILENFGTVEAIMAYLDSR